MLDLRELPERAQMYLLSAIESGHGVKSRADLYSWARNAVWSAFPHDLMACLLLDEQGEVQKFECLHSSLLPATLLSRLGDSQEGLLVALLRRCREAGIRHLALGADGVALPVAISELAQEWLDLDLGGLWLVDSGDLPGGCSSCFILIGSQLDARSPLWPLVPLLSGSAHLALRRTLALQTGHPDIDLMDLENAGALTERQQEILSWVRQGKTNQEIALIMNISPFTVKNHLQKIFKRMNVSNRTHAVARAANRRTS